MNGELFEHPAVANLRTAETHRRDVGRAMVAANQSVHYLSLHALKLGVDAGIIAEIVGRPVEYIRGLPADERSIARQRKDLPARCQQEDM